MSPATIEQRLSALEKEVADLKTRLQTTNGAGYWLVRVAGSMKDYPEFAEVIRLGREIRQADRPADEE